MILARDFAVKSGAWLLLLLGPWSLVSGRGQVQDSSGAHLLELLDDAHGPRRDPVFTCGSLGQEAAAGRNIAESLARLGPVAVPLIEDKLNLIESHGRQSGYATNAFWLLQAYAKIEKSAALPRLRRMMGSRSLGFLHYSLDAAAALSLGLTSYVDSRRAPNPELCRTEEPRDTLDRLILALQNRDRRRLELTLGPIATAAFSAEFGEKTWRDLLPESMPRIGAPSIAVGYKFDIPGRWSEPPETLEPVVKPAAGSSGRHEIETRFENAAGKECEGFRITFVANPVIDQGGFLIDNQDIGDLLRLLATCSASEASGR